MGNLNKGYRGLEALIELQNYGLVEIVGVIAKYNDLEGHWYQSVARLAKENSIRLFMPKNINDREFAEGIARLEPDWGLSHGSGMQLYKEHFFSIPKNGFLNLHFALLPKYRGMLPIPHAIINGERESGVTLHFIDKGMDTGPIIEQRKTPIFPDETGRDVYMRCEDISIGIIYDFFTGLINYQYPRLQDGKKAITYRQKDLPLNQLVVPLEKGSKAIYDFARAFDFFEYKNPAWAVINGEIYYFVLNPLDYGMKHGECRYYHWYDKKVFLIPVDVFRERNFKQS